MIDSVVPFLLIKARAMAKLKNRNAKTPVAFVRTLAECEPNAAVPLPPRRPPIPFSPSSWIITKRMSKTLTIIKKTKRTIPKVLIFLFLQILNHISVSILMKIGNFVNGSRIHAFKYKKSFHCAFHKVRAKGSAACSASSPRP
jgi:hypothetical protein